jgi:hypothetical protein
MRRNSVFASRFRRTPRHASAVLRQTLTLAAIGLAIGLPAEWMAARAMHRLLVGVASSDPATFGGVFSIVAIIAGLAGFLWTSQR